jgi:hypothetical protein
LAVCDLCLMGTDFMLKLYKLICALKMLYR